MSLIVATSEILDITKLPMSRNYLTLPYNKDPDIQMRQIILAEDLVLPATSKFVTSISVENDLRGMIGLLEPASATINSGI